jgi:NAD(P)-dependent dehydrogenase (short-subunit alcohol dehydrogenase family)
MGDEMIDFEGKVVLITGAGKGTGRMLAHVFAGRGAYVAANDISPVNLDDVAQSAPGKIKTYVEDVAKKVGIQTLVKQVEDDFGRIDVLVNHAAVEPHVSLLDMDEWDLHRVLDVNLTGAFLAIQSVGRVMRGASYGVIINLISIERPQHTQAAAYVASMYGLIALTRVAAEELAPYGICVHAVGRGIGQFQDGTPQVSSDLTGAILYLCGSSLSGQIVNVEDP